MNHIFPAGSRMTSARRLAVNAEEKTFGHSDRCEKRTCCGIFKRRPRISFEYILILCSNDFNKICIDTIPRLMLKTMMSIIVVIDDDEVMCVDWSS